MTDIPPPRAGWLIKSLFDLPDIHMPLDFFFDLHPHGEHVYLPLYRSPADVVAALWPTAPRDPCHAHARLLHEIARWEAAHGFGGGDP